MPFKVPIESDSDESSDDDNEEDAMDAHPAPSYEDVIALGGTLPGDEPVAGVDVTEMDEHNGESSEEDLFEYDNPVNQGGNGYVNSYGNFMPYRYDDDDDELSAGNPPDPVNQGNGYVNGLGEFVPYRYDDDDDELSAGNPPDTAMEEHDDDEDAAAGNQDAMDEHAAANGIEMDDGGMEATNAHPAPSYEDVIALGGTLPGDEQIEHAPAKQAAANGIEMDDGELRISISYKMNSSLKKGEILLGDVVGTNVEFVVNFIANVPENVKTTSTYTTRPSDSAFYTDDPEWNSVPANPEHCVVKITWKTSRSVAKDAELFWAYPWGSTPNEVFRGNGDDDEAGSQLSAKKPAKKPARQSVKRKALTEQGGPSKMTRESREASRTTPIVEQRDRTHYVTNTGFLLEATKDGSCPQTKENVVAYIGRTPEKGDGLYAYRAFPDQNMTVFFEFMDVMDIPEDDPHAQVSSEGVTLNPGEHKSRYLNNLEDYLSKTYRNSYTEVKPPRYSKERTTSVYALPLMSRVEGAADRRGIDAQAAGGGGSATTAEFFQLMETINPKDSERDIETQLVEMATRMHAGQWLHHVRFEGTAKQSFWKGGPKTKSRGTSINRFDTLCAIVGNPTHGPISVNLGENHFTGEQWRVLLAALLQGRVVYQFIDSVDSIPLKELNAFRVHIQEKRKKMAKSLAPNVPWLCQQKDVSTRGGEYAAFTREEVNNWILTGGANSQRRQLTRGDDFKDDPVNKRFIVDRERPSKPRGKQPDAPVREMDENLKIKDAGDKGMTLYTAKSTSVADLNKLLRFSNPRMVLCTKEFNTTATYTLEVGSSKRKLVFKSDMLLQDGGDDFSRDSRWFVDTVCTVDARAKNAAPYWYMINALDVPHDAFKNTARENVTTYGHNQNITVRVANTDPTKLSEYYTHAPAEYHICASAEGGDEATDWAIFYRGHAATEEKNIATPNTFNVTFVDTPAGIACTLPDNKTIPKDTELLLPVYYNADLNADDDGKWPPDQPTSAEIELELVQWIQAIPAENKAMHEALIECLHKTVLKLRRKDVTVETLFDIIKYEIVCRKNNSETSLALPTLAQMHETAIATPITYIASFIDDDYTVAPATTPLQVDWLEPGKQDWESYCVVDGLGRDPDSKVPVWNREGSLRFKDGKKILYYVHNDIRCGYGVFAGCDFSDETNLIPFLTGDLCESEHYTMQLETKMDTLFLCPGAKEILRAAHYINGVPTIEQANVMLDKANGDFVTRCDVKAGDQLTICYTEDPNDIMNKMSTETPTANLAELLAGVQDVQWTRIKDTFLQTALENNFSVSEDLAAELTNTPYALANDTIVGKIQAEMKTRFNEDYETYINFDEDDEDDEDDERLFTAARKIKVEKALAKAKTNTKEANDDHELLDKWKILYDIASKLQTVPVTMEQVITQARAQIDANTQLWQNVNAAGNNEWLKLAPYGATYADWNVGTLGFFQYRWDAIKLELQAQTRTLRQSVTKLRRTANYNRHDEWKIEAMLEIAMVAISSECTMSQAYEKMNACTLDRAHRFGEAESDRDSSSDDYDDDFLE